MPRYARRRTTRTTRKRAPTRKYRRPTRPRRKSGGKMTNKKMLDLTSTKKRDTMLIYTNVPGGTTYTTVPANLTPGITYVYPWIATWRDNTVQSGGTKGSVIDMATRTSTTCYMRGLKEKIGLNANDGSQWLWRRICFTMKGPALYGLTTAGYSFALETSSGFARVVNDINTTTGGQPMYAALSQLLFRGAANTDWNNLFTAPVDNTRVSIKYDKTVNFSSGNQNGRFRIFNRWHAMNSNLAYNDDESGGTELTAGASTNGKAGMGDYYVVDMFICPNPQSSSTSLQFAPEATLYWHEK